MSIIQKVSKKSPKVGFGAKKSVVFGLLVKVLSKYLDFLVL